ncbi:hypothetical protein EDM80_11985 [bacterium]|nr:MAG: hypothetical protein EDM80_11985 [bacterium]RIK61905.1 MAG: hypothetical protein DCC64_11910 [Planctomycetota bacterium]
MSATITVLDSTLAGETTNEIQLHIATETPDVRELIRSRVYQEVKDYNAGLGERFRGLVQPAGSTQVAGGFRLPKRQKIDWQEQFRVCVEAFERGHILILLDDRQLESLDERLELRSTTRVNFLRLVPLVGG